MKNRVFKKHEFRFISIWLMKHSDTAPWELYSEHILNAVNTWAFHDTSIILAVLTKKFNFIVKFIFFMFYTKKHKSFRFFSDKLCEPFLGSFPTPNIIFSPVFPPHTRVHVPKCLLGFTIGLVHPLESPPVDFVRVYCRALILTKTQETQRT